jgi:hypothetical protein
VDAHWAGKAIFGLLEKQIFLFFIKSHKKKFSIKFKLKTFVSLNRMGIVFETFKSPVNA